MSRFQDAIQCCKEVREMTVTVNTKEYAMPGTMLWNVSRYPVQADGTKGCDCQDYYAALKSLILARTLYALSEIRQVYADFLTGVGACHTFLEVLDVLEEGQLPAWRLIDSTFGLTAQNTAGNYVGASYIQDCFYLGSNENIEYKFNSKFNDSLVKGYWYDYPTMFRGLYLDSHKRPIIGKGPTPWPNDCNVVDINHLPGKRAYGYHSLIPSFDVIEDGRQRTVNCNLSGNISDVKGSTTIKIVDPSIKIDIWYPKRYIF